MGQRQQKYFILIFFIFFLNGIGFCQNLKSDKQAQVLNSNEYTNSMISELNRLTEEYRTFRKCY